MAFTASSFQVCHKSGAPKIRSWSGKWTLPPQHIYTHTHLKPEPQEVALRSILSGQTNYSPFEKMHLFPLSYIYPPPSSALLSLLVFFSSFIVFISDPLERNSEGDKKALLPALSQNELHSDSKGAAAAVTQPPKFREIFSCGVP